VGVQTGGVGLFLGGPTGSFPGRGSWISGGIHLRCGTLHRYGINVNVVARGRIVPESRDDVGDNSFWRQWGYDFYTPDVLKRAMRFWLIGRLGRPEDIADAVLFLSSECASFLTGQTISVSGGLSMW